MSVIQKIRDKYARWAVIAIAVSLLGFILMDAFAGRTGLFSNSQSTTLGKINGSSIKWTDFETKVKKEEAKYERQNYAVNEETRQQIRTGLWDREVSDRVLGEEYEKLGLTVTDKEMRDVLYGSNPPQDLKQKFSDPKTGQYNAVAAEQAINSMKKDPLQKGDIEDYLDYLKSQRLKAKYAAMMTNTVFFPKWFVEKRNADNSLMARISYINVPYGIVNDSTIKVTDDEIRDYMKKHEEEFEQKQESRSIAYVLFSAAPSSKDSMDARNALFKMKSSFDTVTEKSAAQFVQVNGSAFPYYDAFISKKTMQQPNKDSITSQPVGVAYGPYLDVNNQSGKGLYVMSKILAVKQRPDSVTARHILIATAERDQQGQMIPKRDDSTAKKLMDSVRSLLGKGWSFDSLVKKFSDDQGSKDSGGVYKNITSGQMVSEFDNFIFDHGTGAKDVVKTPFGYHYIEILSQKGSSTAYKIAYLTKDIETSVATEGSAHQQANIFYGSISDLKSFDANYDKTLKSKNIPKLVAPDIDPMAQNITGVQGNARAFVRKVFETDRDKVMEPEKIGDNYIVAVVTDVTEPGLRSVNTVRPYLEPVLKNKKKAEVVKKNIGQITTLEAAAAKMNQQISTLDSVSFGGGKIGYEPKVLGAAFNPANKGKVVTEAIPGQSGVFVLRVDNVFSVPVPNANVEEQQRSLEMQEKQQIMGQIQNGRDVILETLKRAADIKDNRVKFF